MDPRDAGFVQRAEWAPHERTWLAFPYRRDEWGDALERAQVEHAALARALVEGGEAVELLVADADVEHAARRALGNLAVRYRRLPYGDSWTRDTGPIFVTDGHGRLGAVRFHFDGWGGKFRIPGDAELAGRITEALGIPTWPIPWVVEGGGLEVDGEGTCLTTRPCLLDPRRNPAARQGSLEEALRGALGVDRVVWLDAALINDHTDGHVDTLARFVAPGVVACMEPESRDDPNYDALMAVRNQLSQARDAAGRRLEVVVLPSPGRVHGSGGELLPASYCNFYVANGVVVVPVYDRPGDDEAVARIGRCFPGRHTLGLRALETLHGGGAWHCITREQPASGPARGSVTG